MVIVSFFMRCCLLTRGNKVVVAVGELKAVLNNVPLLQSLMDGLNQVS